MTGISAVIITKNEEANIKRCLDSLSFADEIIVVDSGSLDRTEEICKEYENLSFLKTDWLGFGLTKQYGIDKASNDWIFSIDADEEISAELSEKLRTMIHDMDESNAYYIKRKTFYIGKFINYCGWQRDYVLRLFNRKYGKFNSNMVHESVVHSGTIFKVDEPLYHYSYPDLEAHINKINLYTSIAARESFEKGKKTTIISGFFHGFFRFFNMYLFNLGFLCGKEGLLLCMISSFGVSLKYFKLWSLNRFCRKK